MIYKSKSPFDGADDRGRTGTGISSHGILSPGRLPVPPLRHSNINITEWDLQGSNLWPSACKADALPAELRSQIMLDNSSV